MVSETDASGTEIGWLDYHRIFCELVVVRSPGQKTHQCRYSLWQFRSWSWFPVTTDLANTLGTWHHKTERSLYRCDDLPLSCNLKLTRADLLDSSRLLQTYDKLDENLHSASLSPNFCSKTIPHHLLHHAGDCSKLHGSYMVCNHLPMYTDTSSMG